MRYLCPVMMISKILSLHFVTIAEVKTAQIKLPTATILN